MWAIRLSPRELLLEDPSLVSQLATCQAGGHWPRSADGANQYRLEGWEVAPVCCACLAGSLLSWRELSVLLVRQPCPPACQMPATNSVFISELQSTL